MSILDRTNLIQFSDSNFSIFKILFRFQFNWMFWNCSFWSTLSRLTSNLERLWSLTLQFFYFKQHKFNLFWFNSFTFEKLVFCRTLSHFQKRFCIIILLRVISPNLNNTWINLLFELLRFFEIIFQWDWYCHTSSKTYLTMDIKINFWSDVFI